MSLLAGTATVDITPPTGSKMAAFPHKQRTVPRRAEGVLDPLKARALVLRSHDATVAICSVDLCAIRKVSVDRIRSAVAEQEPALGQGRVLIAATHTHAGAETSFLFGAMPDDADVHAIEARVAEAILAAEKSLTPVRLAWGRTQLGKTHNRRVIDRQGRAGMSHEYVPGKTTGPVDSDLHVISFNTLDGATKAVILHYTAHALTLGPKNLSFSADFPGRACEILEKIRPGCTALFLNGAAGNIHPHECMRADTEALGSIGQAVADAAQRAMIAAQPVSVPVLRLTSDTLALRNRTDETLEVHLEVAALRLGPLILGFAPGELFVEFQLAFRDGIAPHPGTIVGYANGFPGYVPPLSAYKEGGYGVELAEGDPPQWCRTSVPPGAGEQMIDRLLELAGEVMLGDSQLAQ